MQIEFIKHTGSKIVANAVVYFVDDSKRLGSSLQIVDAGKDISKAIAQSIHFDWKEAQHLHVVAPNYAEVGHLFIISVGNKEAVSHAGAQRVGAKIADLLNQYKLESAKLVIDDAWGDDGKCMWASLLSGVKLKNYSFDKYFIAKKEERRLSLHKVEVLSSMADKLSASYSRQDIIAESVIKVRDLVTEPANVLYPSAFMECCLALKELGIKVTVLSAQQMKEQGMGAIIGVGQGSVYEPYTVIMEWKPEGASDQTIALAGKGVCFDTGGLNIKSSASNIADMKDDMGGAAVVFGTMQAIAKQQLKVHVVGILGLVENATSGSAQRPSDVVNTMSGQTVEVENTDAEGRLVLCDIMWYVQKHYNPYYLIDIATLTGAVVIALGEGGYAGLFSNDDEMAERLLQLGKDTGEMLWRLPLAEHYDKQIDSEIADMRNTGTWRGGGATIAAQFLQRFVQSGRKWAHIDIANVAWNKKGTPIAPKGATGFGVSLLERFIKELSR